MLISVHVPKTAGTSFFQFLAKNFGGEILRDYGSETLEVSHLFESCFGEIDAIKSTGYFRLKIIAEGLQRLRSEIDRRGITAIHGHYRVDKYFGIFPNAKYAIWLREPFKRCLSQYFFHRRVLPGSANPVQRAVHEHAMSFEDFISVEENINLQYKMAGGDLRKFDFVGVTERYEVGLQQFCSLFGLPRVAQMDIDRANVNPDSRIYDEYLTNDDIKQRFMRLNERDVELYDTALRASGGS